MVNFTCEKYKAVSFRRFAEIEILYCVKIDRFNDETLLCILIAEKGNFCHNFLKSWKNKTVQLCWCKGSVLHVINRTCHNAFCYSTTTLFQVFSVFQGLFKPAPIVLAIQITILKMKLLSISNFSSGRAYQHIKINCWFLNCANL